MIHTPAIERAIQKAAVLHRGQTRKGKLDYPYVTHLFSVAVILSQYTEDEDVIIAGLLHDSIEDTHYSPEALEKEFGLSVKDIVLGVTEEKMRNGKKLPWKERKLGYIKNLETVSLKSLMVSAADKIHNLQSIINEYNQLGESFWEMLKPGAKEQLWYNREVLSILQRRLDNPIVKKYERVFKEALQIFS